MVPDTVGHKTEAQWQAESDARALANAAEIKADPGRLRKAGTAAKKLAAQVMKEANAMRSVAKTSKGKKNGKR